MMSRSPTGPSLMSLEPPDADVFSSEEEVTAGESRQRLNKVSADFVDSLVAEFSDEAPTKTKSDKNRFKKTLSNRATDEDSLSDADEAAKPGQEAPKAPSGPAPGGNWKGIQKTRKMISAMPLRKSTEEQKPQPRAPEPVAPSASAPEPRWTDLRKSRHRFATSASLTSTASACTVSSCDVLASETAVA